MDLKKERFLITGASGFVGACLARRLAQMGLEVHAMVPAQGDLWRLEDILPSLTLHRGEITDETFVRDLVARVAPSIIYHMAAHGAYSTQNDTRRILMTNVLGTWNLLDALDKVPYKLFVNTGSSSEYGFTEKPMQEDDLPRPNSYYAVSKVSQTMLCQYTAQAQKKPIVTLRLFSVYGPYEDPGRLVATIIRRCLQGETLHMASAGTARDFIFVEDVIDAYLNIGRLQASGGGTFNIGTGRQVTLKDITGIVLNLTDARVDVQWNAMQDRIWDTSVWVGDIQRTKEILGWQAKTTLEQGLRQTMEWFKKR